MARACDDGLGSGFRETDTPSTTSTIPSSTPNLDQPCSLISLERGAELIGVEIEKLDPLENSEIGDSTLRCRFSSLTDDKTHFISFNVFVYKNQEEFNKLRNAPNSSSVNGDFDSGFTLQRNSPTDMDNLFGAQKGDIKLAVSSNLAVVVPNADLDKTQYEVLDFEQLQQILESILEKL